MSTIYIYIYYNLIHNKIIYLERDNVEEEISISSEVAIIIDEKIVKEILKNPKTEINKHGDFIGYDIKYLEDIVLNDLYNYKETISNVSFKVDSFYYIKCELVKDISNEISNFLNSI